MKTYKYNLKCTKNPSYEGTIVESSLNAVEFARKLWKSDIALYESSFILLLNNKNEVFGWSKISQGGVSCTIVDVRLIAKYAIDTFATGVILLHNHPSGNLNPSKQDKELTKNSKEGLKLFGIQLLDHIIVTEESFFSFNDEGMLNF